MSMTQRAPEPGSPLDALTRPGWQRWGGGTTLVAGILLVAATCVEYFVLGPGAPAAIFALFLVLFGLSTVLSAAGAVMLALGRPQDAGRPHHGGIVADSAPGRLALLASVFSWLVSQTAYIGYTYLVPPSETDYYLTAISTFFLAFTIIAGVVAAAVIFRRHVVIGTARWILFAALALAVVAWLVIGLTPDDLAVQTIVETVSALGQAVVGLSYYLAKRR